MCQHQAVQTHWHRSRENREYVRQLLTERQPELFAVLQLAERQVDLELSREAPESSGLVQQR
jgi:hypothetical protein